MNEIAIEEYTENLSKGTIYKNDIILAEKFQINDFDPLVIPKDITGGIIAIIAATGTGKTFLLRDILSKIHENYDRFYLFSGTAKLQKDYDFFPKEFIFEHYSELKMEELWEINYGHEDPERVLIILDDVINDPEFIKSLVLKKYATGSRHVKITVFLLTQFLNSLKPIIRNNLRLVITFESDNYKERRKFIDEYLSLINPRVGDLVYKKITSVPFQCIVISVYKKDKNNKVYKYIASKVDDSQLELVSGKPKKKKYGPQETWRAFSFVKKKYQY